MCSIAVYKQPSLFIPSVLDKELFLSHLQFKFLYPSPIFVGKAPFGCACAEQPYPQISY